MYKVTGMWHIFHYWEVPSRKLGKCAKGNVQLHLYFFPHVCVFICFDVSKLGFFSLSMHMLTGTHRHQEQEYTETLRDVSLLLVLDFCFLKDTLALKHTEYTGLKQESGKV